MRYVSVAIALSLILFARSPATADSLQKKALVIGLDGIRADALDAALAQGRVPNLQSLIDEGSYANHGQTARRTFSGPAWSNILHGVDIDEHRVETNDVAGAIFANSKQDQFPNILARVKMFDDQLTTSLFNTWEPLHVTRTPSGDDHAEFKTYKEGGDEYVTGKAVIYLTQHDPDVVFFYQGEIDGAGHGAGGGRFHPESEPYLAQIELTDSRVGQVLAAVRNRPTYAEEDWLFVVVTDHGGTGTRHGDNIDTHRTIPFIVSGRNVPRQRPDDNPVFVGPKPVDVIPTVLAHLGVPRDHPAWDGLRGHPRGQAPCLQPEIALGKNLVFNGDAEYDRGFADHSHDQAVSGWHDSAGKDGITILRYDTIDGFPLFSCPGPEDRGNNYFAAGSDSQSATITQTIDMTVAKDLDREDLQYELSAWLGGAFDREDSTWFTARFLDADGEEIDSATVGPVTAADREQVSGLYHRQTSGLLPPNTAAVEFVLQTEGNHAFADELVFVLTR